MITRLAIIVACLLAALPNAARAEETAVDEWIVVLTDTRPERRRGWSSGVGYSGSYNYADDPKLARLARDIADDYELTVTEQWPIRALNVHCVVVRLGEDQATTLAELRADKRVEWVQPLNEFEGLAAEADPYRHLQGSLDIMNVEPLHEHVSGAGVRIAMIDSGVESDHPDLMHALAGNTDFVGRGGLSERHGTGIAGVLVAHGSNGVGIAGVAPGAELHAYRACWESSEGSTRCNSLTLSLALDHALTIRPHVVNLSLTGPTDRLLDALVERLTDEGAMVVAAWDVSRGVSRFPSPRPGVVYAGDGTGVTAESTDVLYAPGSAVLTAQPGHGYDYMAGSSLAAAHVSGVMALLIEANPGLDGRATEATLASSVRHRESGTSIDACDALVRSVPEIHCGARISASDN